MTPNEIQNRRFDKAMSGYRPDEVNSYMSEIANYVEGILKEKAELEQKMMVLAEKLEEYREDEDSLRAALIGAQKLGDSVVRESKRKAEMILAEAQQKSDSMVSHIKANIQRETDHLNRVQAEVAKFKGEILSLYKQHIELINSLPNNEEKDLPKPQPKQTAPAPKQTEPPQLKVQSYGHAAEPEKTVEVKIESAEPPEPPRKPEKEFILRFNDDDPDVPFEEVEIDRSELLREDSPRRESRHGDLLFGDKYTLTRKD